MRSTLQKVIAVSASLFILFTTVTTLAENKKPEENLAKVAKTLPPVPSLFRPDKSGVLVKSDKLMMKSGGSIQGGGGGTFSIPMFWRWVYYVKVGLLAHRESGVLSPDQIDKVIGLMNSNITSITVTEKALAAKNKNGILMPVDALNFPSQHMIVLNKTAWENHFKSGLEFRHLILHEFLGLAKIDDTDNKISSTYFDSLRRPIPFAWNNVDCEASGSFLYHSDEKLEMMITELKTQDPSFVSYYGLDKYANPYGQLKGFREIFAEPKLIGNASTPGYPCKFPSESNKNCVRDQRRLYKLMSHEAELSVQENFWRNKVPRPRFFAKYNVSLANYFESPNFVGINRTEANLTGQLLVLDPVTDSKTVISIQSSKAISLDEDGDLQMEVQLQSPEIPNALLNAGIEIGPALSSEGNSDHSGAQNILNLLEDYADANGVKNHTDAALFLNRTVLKNLAPVVPLNVTLSCWIYHPHP